MGLNANLSGNEDTKLVLNNANIKSSKIKLDQDASLVIGNTSGETISFTDACEINATGGQSVTFTGNSDIDFKGIFAGSGSTKGIVEMDNATVIRTGADRGIEWNLNKGTLKYTDDRYLIDNALVFNGGALDLRNGAAYDIPLSALTINNNSKIYLDADLANGKMDSFLNIGSSSVTGDYKIQVDGVTLLSDCEGDSVTIPFVRDSAIANAVEFTGDQGIYYSPIYRYFVDYDEDNGNFEFAKFNTNGAGGGKAVDAYNPAVLSASISQQGAYLAQLQAYDTAFANMDMLMIMPKEERQALKYGNKYVSSDTENPITFSPIQTPEASKGIWFRPYTSFESVDMSGASVSNVNYGSLVGGDTGIIEHGKGWNGMYSAYVGYNGSHQNYKDVGIYQNGGLLGLSGIWYKNNFFTGLTANVGASGATSHTMYGNEDFGMLSTGVASKTGYNWELADGKFIIQPSYLMSYTFVNTFDYTNAAGVKIDASPLNTIQIAPGIKLIGNLKNSWQPYIGVQMVWNVMDKTKIKANDVKLPEMSIDPYVQYGLGLQKRVGNSFTGFGEAMFRGGGRNGASFNFGFRWALGKK